MRRLPAILLMLAAGAPGGLCYDFTALSRQGHLTDYAHVVRGAERRAAIESYCQGLAEAADADVAIVTIQALYGEPVEDVAAAMFRKWQVGANHGDRGVLLLLATFDQRTRVEAGDGFPAGFGRLLSSSAIDAMSPYLAAGDREGALLAGVAAVGSRVAQQRQATLATRLEVPRPPSATVYFTWTLAAGVAALLLFLALIAARGRFASGYRNRGWLGRLLFGRPRRRHSGGGFGAFDSWDTYQGFGGGDGPGGRSSGW